LIAGLVFLSALVISGSPARAVTGFDSAYQFESAFLANLKPGDSGTFSVFFANTGPTAWVAGTGTQVNLAACLDDKVTCGVAPEEAAWNPDTWLSSTAYATHAKTAVVPGDFSAFTYSIKVPAAVSVGSYRFNGDLVLASTGAKIHPEGYYQDASVATVSSGAAAPSDFQAFVGNYDGGTTNNDVRLLFTAPAANNNVQAYEIQRAVGSCPIANNSPAFNTIVTLTIAAGVTTGHTDNDRAPGFYCYQVRVTNPTTGAYSYSDERTATIFGSADSVQPTSTSAILTSSAGFASTLDANDQFVIQFSEPMRVGLNASIRLTDADCGPPTSQSSDPPPCSGLNSQTVADVVCGTNASCALSLDQTALTVTMTGNPIDQSPGSAPGVQFPAVITDSLGITDTAGNRWSLPTSADRVIGPQGQ
jgi:hypothetical protein